MTWQFKGVCWLQKVDSGRYILGGVANDKY